MGVNLRERIDAAPMSRFQWSAIAVCVLLNVLDGYDVLVMAFTATGVSAEWRLTGTELGLLLSAGLVGMALGSLFLAPFADKVGRRAMILLCLVLATTGMGLSALSQSAVQLGLTRVLTGVGIGGILAGSNVISAEYANRRWRSLAVSLNSTGYAIGATGGGIVAAVLQSTSGWRAVFALGAAATALLIPAVLWRLPESLDFLLTQRSLERLNRSLAAMKHPQVEAMPEVVPAPAGKVRQILAPGLRRNTLLTWAGFFMLMFAFYFVTTWTPKLLVQAGLAADQGITGGVLLNLGGIFGSTLIGLLAARFALKRVLVAYTVVTAALLLAFVPATSALAAAFALGALIGLFVNGCVAGLYALTPAIYDAPVRATGVGWGIGIGRIGAIISPVVAGRLLDAGWGPGQLFALVSGVLVLGGLAVHAFRLSPSENPAGRAPAASR
ncbi:MFS transporter [Nonomuraea africana]|uniref:Benzoate transport n=1 Tax=Nonomuraea africana TaxID=46171 RepID=A0ABR9KIT1_9ACTN|nr:MFS transporter [Nonomuraea africana]MBE1561920.1 benzoate transport [Nonomuraea africana]